MLIEGQAGRSELIALTTFSCSLAENNNIFYRSELIAWTTFSCSVTGNVINTVMHILSDCRRKYQK